MKTVILVEIEPSFPGEPPQTIRAEVVKVARGVAHVRHHPGRGLSSRATSWTMPVDRKTGAPIGDWAWRVREADLPL